MKVQFSLPPLRGKRQVDEEPSSLQQDEDEGEGAVVQWSNAYHKTLRVECAAGFGLYLVRSVYHSGAKDRVFLFQCKRVSLSSFCPFFEEFPPRIALQVAPLTCISGYDPNKRTCKWYKTNNVGVAGSFQCPANYYMAGVYSAVKCHYDRE